MPATPDNGGSAPETVLAFDFGLRRIGVAVGQSVTASANPLGVVANGENGPDFDAIAKLIKEWQPSRLIVGMPLHADGQPGEMQAHVEEFVRELWRFQLPVDTIDERYTSIQAEEALKQARASGTRGRITREMIDSAAAVFIAERFLMDRTNV
ncbi:MAG: Holliday junction resolvase RuvX [Woeseiaceae bacterium]|nr:Holliday junction resolvase RuvX [Woeseiaceae bacterium]